jgi:hypothetical protein
MFITDIMLGYKHNRMILVGKAGWTEDYYFPNLSAFERYRFNVGKSPNPVQLFTRWEVNRDRLERLERLEVVI